MTTLWQALRQSATPSVLHGRDASVDLATLSHASLFPNIARLEGRSVLLATRDQLPTALALAELDGVARRMTLCTPDLQGEQLAAVAALAEADVQIFDQDEPPLAGLDAVKVSVPLAAAGVERNAARPTEWVLLTSGTTATPKLVVHSLASLSFVLQDPQPGIWSTFYDIRRYGGLQIYLRALLSGSPMVLSGAGKSPQEFLQRAASAGVSHMTGTPSHWRSAIMSGALRGLVLRYVRLSGEIADQTILDALRAACPGALVAHAFASTEGGVLFEVEDGQTGFPDRYVDSPWRGVHLKILEGTLRVKSGGLASRYLGADMPSIRQPDGYLDTGDLIEHVEGRCFFRGRTGGVINIGGLKVYPQEVEEILNAEPRVASSLVKARANAITGAIVVAEVVLKSPADAESAALVAELLGWCRARLPSHKVPAMLRVVQTLDMTAAGKLVRHRA